MYWAPVRKVPHLDADVYTLVVIYFRLCNLLRSNFLLRRAHLGAYLPGVGNTINSMILRCTLWIPRRITSRNPRLHKPSPQTQWLLARGRNSLHTIAMEGEKVGVEDSEAAAIRDLIWGVQNGGR